MQLEQPEQIDSKSWEREAEEALRFYPTWLASGPARIRESPDSSFELAARRWVVGAALAAFVADLSCLARLHSLHLVPCLQLSVHSETPLDDPALLSGGPFSAEQ